MSKNSKSYTQFELFPVGSKKEFQPPNTGFNTRTFTLSVEHIVGMCIIFIVSMVVGYCLGVNKGKTANLAGSPAEKNIADNYSESAIIVRSDEPKIETIEVAIPPEEIEETKVEVLEIELPEETIESFNYTIQVASFKRITSAEKEALNLKKKGYETSVIQKGNYSIVCVGKFVEHQEAKKFSKRLKDRYKDCLVRRL